MGIAEPTSVLAALANPPRPPRPNREIQVLRVAMRILSRRGYTKASVDCAHAINTIRSETTE